jgi:hypothetical protein
MPLVARGLPVVDPGRVGRALVGTSIFIDQKGQ